MKNPLVINVLAIVLVAFGLLSQQQVSDLLEFSQEISSESASTSSTVAGATVSATTVTYLVEKVVDGDTIKVRVGDLLETVRLVGINTPESVDPRKAVECFGVEAATQLKAILLGQRVSLQKDQTQADRDRYGRLLRFVFLDDQDVGLWLLKEGYAKESLYSNQPHVYRDMYIAAEQLAKTAERGLWAKTACEH